MTRQLVLRITRLDADGKPTGEVYEKWSDDEPEQGEDIELSPSLLGVPPGEGGVRLPED